ncbi:Cob(I)yrinic acid a,c-diamide adenosyltransferase [Natranaerofaba carboxydovora]|nr:Cob(I)yrinic acid a,c-diamide adenosyltransferase [Natranaerofaba carboxydovora]
MKCVGCGECFVSSENCTDEDKKVFDMGLKRAMKFLESEEYFLLVLDEILDLVQLKILSVGEIKSLISIKTNTELIMTGHDVPDEITEDVDLITEMKSVKHPFEKGIEARRGIEF